MTITNRQSLGEHMNWEHGEHSGTISFPSEERGPVDIQWDNDPPDNYEEIEALVEAAASNAKSAGTDASENTL
jgi:hypothetical protein